MHLNHHFNHLTQYFLNKELSEIYITVALRSFAISLVSIFVPIYLLKQGFALQQVFLFYFIVSSIWLICSYFSAKLSTKIGLKHNILLSIPFLIAFYLLLPYVTLDKIFFLAPVLLGIHGSLFWLNFHIDFAEFSSKKKRAEQISGYAIICLILSALGPIIGGLLLLFTDFNILFIITSIILVISVIPLFMSKEIYTPKNFSTKKVKEIIKKIELKTMAGFAGYGMICCAIIIWPIFIFLILKEYLSVGALVSVTLLFSIIFTFLVGRWADKFGKGKVLRIGSILTALGWIIIIFVKTGLQILGINIFFGIVSPAGPHGPAFDAITYDQAKKKHITEIITIREIIIHGSKALVFAVLYFISSFPLAFILGALGCLGAFAFSFQKKRI